MYVAAACEFSSRWRSLSLADLGLFDLGLADLGLADLGLADLGLADLGLADLGLFDLGLFDLGGYRKLPILLLSISIFCRPLSGWSSLNAG